MPDGPTAFFLPTPVDQELTRVLHRYLRSIGRDDLRAIIEGVFVTGDVVTLAMEGSYADADRPVVRFGMGLVAERLSQLRGTAGKATVPIPLGRYDLAELLRRRAGKRG